MNPPPEPAPPTTLRLTSADFDAYIPERGDAEKDAPAWARHRQELGLRMLAWAGGVVARLAELGIFVEATAQPATDRGGRHVQGQRVLFLLREDASDAYGAAVPSASRRGRLAARRAHLTLAIDAAHVEVSIELPSEATVDLYNLRARLRDPERAQELTTALEALPEQFAMGLLADSQKTRVIEPWQGASAMAELFAKLSDRPKSVVWIGWNVPREVATKHSLLLDEQLEDAIVALGPAFKLITWVPDNDLAAAEGEVTSRRERRDTRREKRRARAESMRSRDSVAVVRPRKSDAQAKKRNASDVPEPTRPLLRATLRDGPRIPSSGAARPELNLARLGPPGRLTIRRPSVGAFDPHAPIEKGARVRVLAGPFAGKVGFVQELDGKGRARVMLGLLATRVEVKNLVACTEGRDRPALSSSHRKPLPAR